MQENSELNLAGKRDLIVVKTFDAPVRLVWKAWTTPEGVMRWWGPDYFTSPTCRIDLRIGGKYLFCMQAPNGDRYYTTGVYHKILEFERLEMSQSFANEKGEAVPSSAYGLSTPNVIRTIVTFEALPDDRTKLTLIQSDLAEDRMFELAASGWATSLEKLARSLSYPQEN